jgi:SAM-dependent methyltransferase
MAYPNEWIEFFDNHAPEYEKNIFVKNTASEIKFIVEELNLPKGKFILDMGCGTGRHSVGLAGQGYKMTGVDWSSGMLNEAKKAAMKADVEIELVCEDAKMYRAPGRFDAAICLCEGAFGLLLKGEDPVAHDLTILRNIFISLKRGGKLILGALNGLAKIRAATKDDYTSGKFDPVTLIETFTMSYKTADGIEREVTLHEHGFLPGELIKLCHDVGFNVLHLWGGTAGNWRRAPLDPDEIEIMLVASKPG